MTAYDGNPFTGPTLAQQREQDIRDIIEFHKNVPVRGHVCSFCAPEEGDPVQETKEQMLRIFGE